MTTDRASRIRALCSWDEVERGLRRERRRWRCRRVLLAVFWPFGRREPLGLTTRSRSGFDLEHQEE